MEVEIIISITGIVITILIGINNERNKIRFVLILVLDEHSKPYANLTLLGQSGEAVFPDRYGNVRIPKGWINTPVSVRDGNRRELLTFIPKGPEKLTIPRNRQEQ